jgi:hypothetical protein
MTKQINKHVGDTPSPQSLLSTELKKYIRSNIEMSISFLDIQKYNRISYQQYAILYLPIFIGGCPERQLYVSEQPSSEELCAFINLHLINKYNINPPLIAVIKNSKDLLSDIREYTIKLFN